MTQTFLEPINQLDLRPKQRRFVDEYLCDLNGTKAAIRAGYAPAGAHVTASRLLSRPEVRACIERALAQQFNVSKLSLAEELAAIAFANLGDYLTWSDGIVEVVPSDQLSEWQLKAVASVRQTGPGGKYVEVRLADKLKAIELLGRILGLFEPQSSQAKVPMGNARFVIEESS